MTHLDAHPRESSWRPHPKVATGAGVGALVALALSVFGVHVSDAQGALIDAVLAAVAAYLVPAGSPR